MATEGITMTCACGEEADIHDMVGIEYAYGSPNRYDGVSEWLFPDGHRVGRWSGKLLGEGEEELRHGGR